MTNKTHIQQQGSNAFSNATYTLRNFLSLGKSTEKHELLNKVHTKETKSGIELARRLLRDSIGGNDTVFASPFNGTVTGKDLFISCGRKFKSLLDEVESRKRSAADFVTLHKIEFLVFLVLVMGTIRLVVRWLRNRQRRIEARIAAIIERSEEELVLHTEARIRYSTEYTHLTIGKVDKLFKQGCLSLRKDAPSASSPGETESSEFTREGWLMLTKENEGKDLSDWNTIRRNDLIRPGDAFKGTWHALWNEPPRVDAGLWDVTMKTQKISYDVIYLGRDSNRRKIRYNSATDFGLCSSWLDFFYQVNDDVPNFLRNWDSWTLNKPMERLFSLIEPHHQLMTPPNETFPMLVPCHKQYRLIYFRQHRIKIISDKIITTMRTNGDWNPDAFMATYRNVVGGNSQISMGHRLSDRAMIDYLPLIEQNVYASRAQNRVSK